MEAYEESAAYNSAKKAGAEVQPIDETQIFTVKFVDEDYTEFVDEDYAVQKVAYGEFAKDPKITPPEKTGKIFTGWDFDFENIPITRDIVIKAKAWLKRKGYSEKI